MAGEPTITIIGNTVADIDLRFTSSGDAVASFTVASTPRTFDRASGEWVDGDAMFLACQVWRQAAENVAESLTKGMRVIVQGRLKSRTYETRDGSRRTVLEVEVEEVGPSLRYATATVNRSTRDQGWQRPAPRTSKPSRGRAPLADPWANQPSGTDEEAPF